MHKMPKKKHTCKCCGSEALVVNSLAGREESTNPTDKVLYACVVCGDCWTSEKIVDDEDNTCEIRFLHHPSMQPQLRRIAYADNPVVINESSIEKWEHYIDNRQVEEDTWMDALSGRRDTIKSIISN